MKERYLGLETFFLWLGIGISLVGLTLLTSGHTFHALLLAVAAGVCTICMLIFGYMGR